MGPVGENELDHGAEKLELRHSLAGAWYHDLLSVDDDGEVVAHVMLDLPGGARVVGGHVVEWVCPSELACASFRY